MTSAIGRIEEAYKLLEQARTVLPTAVDRIYDDYLAGYPSGGTGGGTLIDPTDPSLGSVSLTQPERYETHHDDAAHARKQMTAATFALLDAAKIISNLGAQWGKYRVGTKILERHELAQFACASCKRVNQHRQREPHKKMCSWCEDKNIIANTERLRLGRDTDEMPPIALVRRRFTSGKGKITRPDVIDAVRHEPPPKKKKKRKNPGSSLAYIPTRENA